MNFDELISANPPKPPTKVIFLDIDGVLNSWDTLKNHVHMHPDMAIRVASLCKLHDAKIVVSSSWRLGNENNWTKVKECLRVVGIGQHLVIDRTPSFNDGCRGDEIKAWLENNKTVNKFIIIDDDSDMLEEQMPFFIQTTMEHGFTPEKFNEANEKLKQ